MDQAVLKYQIGDHMGALQDLMPFAEQGDAEAQNLIGAIYAGGPCVVRDHAAAKWYRSSAEQGFAAAQYGFGVMYYNGDGQPQDSILAHVWVSMAIVNGHENAAGVRYTVSRPLSEAGLVLAEEIALRCRRQRYQDCRT